jgi:hypothetical protein
LKRGGEDFDENQTVRGIGVLEGSPRIKPDDLQLGSAR